MLDKYMYTNTDPYTEINCSKSICLLLLRQFHSGFLVRIPVSRIVYGYIPVLSLKI